MSTETKKGTIVRISGPVIDVEGLTGAELYEIVRAGKERLIGEIIKIRHEKDKHVSTVQVYEQTEGLTPGEPVPSTTISAVAGTSRSTVRQRTTSTGSRRIPPAIANSSTP